MTTCTGLHVGCELEQEHIGPTEHFAKLNGLFGVQEIEPIFFAGDWRSYDVISCGGSHT